MTALPIEAFTLTSALGRGRAAQLAALRTGTSGLALGRFGAMDFDAWIGEVAGLAEVRLPAALAEWDCRNHRLAWLALQQDGFAAAVAACASRYGASRVGVFIGTSTSGIEHTETAYRERGADGALPDWFSYRHSQNVYACADFVRSACALSGIAFAISTACSSSAKVFAAAQRAIAAGVCDAAVVGGVDSLCLSTLYGFRALQLVSPDICRPADAQRNGISIGEAAGFALLDPRADVPFQLLGAGESGDAHHMSAPEPEGRGARLAMERALASAGLPATAVDYINLHGTATPANDSVEDLAVTGLFGTQLPCSSTKGWTGHTLGAAGICEAVIALLCLEHGFIPQSLNTRTRDPTFRGDIVLEPRALKLSRVLSNSFGFGGSNCTLLLGTAP